MDFHSNFRISRTLSKEQSGHFGDVTLNPLDPISILLFSVSVSGNGKTGVRIFMKLSDMSKTTKQNNWQDFSHLTRLYHGPHTRGSLKPQC